jgi:uncharacterized protein (TIGR00730 family)
VFCGSNPGTNPAYKAAAAAMGRILGERGITLVYGGGSVGLMGTVADAALAAGGKAIGVIPRSLMEKESGHFSLTELHVVTTMHERKALMSKLSDGFIVMPGGIGTLEEFFEIWSWAQLGIHSKPFGVLNVADYWRSLFTFLDTTVAQGFVKSVHRDLVSISDQPGALIEAMAAKKPLEVFAWMHDEDI